jgi:hypothetical protein
MQNLMSGGKLETRRQIEEAVVNVVKNRVVEPPLDYTILKINGDDKQLEKEQTNPLIVKPGDVLDDATSLDTAVETIIQAVAYQPSARNATLSVSGGLATDDKDNADYWQELFVCLDGPEVYRETIIDDGQHHDDDDEKIQQTYDQLVEYVCEWADSFAASGKGLTTPVRTEHGIVNKLIQPRTIIKQDGVRLLFLPTNTGKNFLSREEEKQRETDRRGGGSATQSSPTTAKRRMAKEGGIDVVVEMVRSLRGGRTSLRVRARRTNYADDSIIKELSENTIIKRLVDALDVFQKQIGSTLL